MAATLLHSCLVDKAWQRLMQSKKELF